MSGQRLNVEVGLYFSDLGVHDRPFDLAIVGALLVAGGAVCDLMCLLNLFETRFLTARNMSYCSVKRV